MSETDGFDSGLPIDSDVDLRSAGQRAELGRAPWPVLSVIALGGALGALARYGLGVAFPTAPNAFPWVTFAINVLGCLLIGALVVVVAEVVVDRPLLRPFVGVGILGGFTTFSAYVVDLARLLMAHAVATALAYLAGTLVAALLAAQVGIAVTERAVAGRRR